MRKGNLIKIGSSCNFKCSKMVSDTGMARILHSDTAVETEAQTDEFDAADDTADAFGRSMRKTPFC